MSHRRSSNKDKQKKKNHTDGKDSAEPSPADKCRKLEGQKKLKKDKIEKVKKKRDVI